MFLRSYTISASLIVSDESVKITAYTFYIDSMAWGYHDYQSIWDNPLADIDLICEWEMGNIHMIYRPWLSRRRLIIPSLDGNLQVVGHMPKKISSICSIFLRRGGCITLSWYKRFVIQRRACCLWSDELRIVRLSNISRIMLRNYPPFCLTWCLQTPLESDACEE